MENSTYLFVNNTRSSDLNNLPKNLEYLMINNLVVDIYNPNLPFTLKEIFVYNSHRFTNKISNMDDLYLNMSISHLFKQANLEKIKIPYGCKITKVDKPLVYNYRALSKLHKNFCQIIDSNIYLPVNRIESKKSKILVGILPMISSKFYRRFYFKQDGNNILYSKEYPKVVLSDSESDSDSDSD